MQFIKYSFIAASIALLAGCTNSELAYRQQAQQVHPLTMPAGVNLKDEQNYYPVPAHASIGDTPKPSLIPPGSHLQQFDTKQAKRQLSMVKWSQDKTGEPILVLSEKANQAWSDVGKALSATTYQVLDRDSSMLSYYILDTAQTGNQITEKTPIYRVYIKAAEDDTAKIFLMSEKNQLVKVDIAKKILQSLQQHLA